MSVFDQFSDDLIRGKAEMANSSGRGCCFRVAKIGQNNFPRYDRAIRQELSADYPMIAISAKVAITLVWYFTFACMLGYPFKYGSIFTDDTKITPHFHDIHFAS